MAFPGTGKIWMNGKLVDWTDATIHVASHVIHYGSGVFEGARCYDDAARLGLLPPRRAHAPPAGCPRKIYRMDTRSTSPAGRTRVLETIRANRMQGLLHPAARSIAATNRSASTRSPARWTRRSCCGNGARISARTRSRRACDVCVSSWTRMAPNTFPRWRRARANYANSALIKMEAIADGYTEGIALDVYGNVSEGSGQNIFLVRDGVIYTPPLGASILGGITRDSVITLARDLGYHGARGERSRARSLYIADEVFFVGTAAEMTPVRSIDKITVGDGRRGPITEAIQRAFFDVINGDVPGHARLADVCVRRRGAASLAGRRRCRRRAHRGLTDGEPGRRGLGDWGLRTIRVDG